MEEDPNGNNNNNIPLKREKNAAELRKSNKPLMEKKRRERINTCLDQLKSILMEVTKKESSYYSKLEKADILEMTVKYLKNFKRQQLAAALATDPNVLGKYIAGFNECTHEVTKYLQSEDGLSTDVRARMLSHLANCLQRSSVVNNSVSAANTNTNLQFTLNQPQPMAVQIPSATPFSTLPGAGGLCVVNTGTSSLQTVPASPMQLVPAKLPNGDTVYLLANPQALTLAGSNMNAAVAMANMAQNLKSLPLAIPSSVIQPAMNSPQSTGAVSPTSPLTPLQVIAPATSTSVDACADPVPSTSADADRKGDVSHKKEAKRETVHKPPKFNLHPVEARNDEDLINNNNDPAPELLPPEVEDQAMWRPW